MQKHDFTRKVQWHAALVAKDIDRSDGRGHFVNGDIYRIGCMPERIEKLILDREDGFPQRVGPPQS
jgi:hypothetical protein